SSLHLAVQLDWRVIAFTAVISIVSGLLFGIAPAWRAARGALVSSLTQHGGAARHGRRLLTGRVLVGSQVALAVLLLIGAGLLLRTLARLEVQQTGFERDNLLMFTVQPGLNGYSGERQLTYYRDLQQNLAALPGVKSV